MVRKLILILLFTSLGAVGSAQNNGNSASDEPTEKIDTSRWQTFRLKNLNVKLPQGFKKIEGTCIHYPCDIFESNSYRIVIFYGRPRYAAWAERSKPDFKENTLKVRQLIARVFKYSADAEFSYIATFPSDQLGQTLANFSFRSKDPKFAEFGSLVLSTVVFRTKLKGSQKVYVATECPVLTEPPPEPFDYEELVRKLPSMSGDEIIRELERRRLFFDLTKERKSSLRRAGATGSVLKVISRLANGAEEQTRVYELFTKNYQARTFEAVKIAYSTGTEFLNRWGCDPLWSEQVKFIKAWHPRLESHLWDPR